MTKLVGILNITPNSFSDGGKFLKPQDTISHAMQLLDQGADILDIGAVSTSYGAKLLNHEEEWLRLHPVLSEVCTDQKMLSQISIDTYNPKTAKECINMGIKMINDVSGGSNLEMLELIGGHSQVKYVLMYSKVLPANRSIRARDFQEIYDFGASSILKAQKYGIKKEQLIFDPGIGFATDPKLSFEVIKNIKLLEKLNIPLYIGHSRKSFFESVSKLKPEDRDIETLAASIYMMMQNISYLRVHNVAIHKRALNVISELANENISSKF